MSKTSTGLITRAVGSPIRRLRKGVTMGLTVMAAGLLSGCSVLSRGFLEAAGPVAAAERHEFYLVGAVMLLVIGPVLLLTPLIAWHYRLANTKSAFRPQWGFSWIWKG